MKELVAKYGGGRSYLQASPLTPLHQNRNMRLTVNLEPDLYALAKSLAKAEDCTVSAAVNRLLRRSLPSGVKQDGRSSGRIAKRNGFSISRGRRPITADSVRQVE